MVSVARPPSAWERIEEATRCEHARQEARRKRLGNGTEHVWLQCLDCGAHLRGLRKADFSPAELSRMREFDEALRDRHQEQRLDLWQRVVAEERGQESAAWWSSYEAYLRTPEWAERRRLVLEREQHLCQACRRRRAVNVHHLTYAHLGNEPLFDLVAVCRECHDRVHGREQAWRS